VNNTFFSLTQRDTYGTHYYSEIIAPSWFIENRTEFIYTLHALNDSTFNAGVAERYQHTKAYDDFYFEPANVWDLSKARSGMILDSINFPLTVNSAQNFPGGPIDTPVPGWPGRYANAQLNAGNDDTNDSQVTSISPFLQATWKLEPDLNLITGARLDYMHFLVKDPLAVAAGIAKTEPNAFINLTDPNFNISFVRKFTPTLSTYITYNYSENYTGALANGGGFSGLTPNGSGGYYLPKGNFDQVSELYEAGFKTSALNNRLFFSSAIFQQSRQQKTQGQPSVQELFHGFEAEMNYQPSKNFYTTLAYSLLVGSLGTPVPFQGYSTNQVPNGPPSPFGPEQTSGNLHVPGYPEHTFTALATYKWDNGIGVSANAVITSTINNDYQGYLVIPWQSTFDGSVFYNTKKYSFKLAATNIFNAHNWTPAYPTYGLESIIPDPGVEIFATVKYKY